MVTFSLMLGFLVSFKLKYLETLTNHFKDKDSSLKWQFSTSFRNTATKMLI